MSHEVAGGMPDDATLQQLVEKLRGAGGDVVRLVVTQPEDITDSLRMLKLLQKSHGGLLMLQGICISRTKLRGAGAGAAWVAVAEPADILDGLRMLALL